MLWLSQAESQVLQQQDSPVRLPQLQLTLFAATQQMWHLELPFYKLVVACAGMCFAALLTLSAKCVVPVPRQCRMVCSWSCEEAKASESRLVYSCAYTPRARAATSAQPLLQSLLRCELDTDVKTPAFDPGCTRH